MKKLLAFVVILLLSACAPSEQSIQTAIVQTQAVWTPIPTQTPYSTNTPYPTLTAPPTVFVTKIVIVTPTFTATLQYTPTITNTPKPTIDPLQKSHGDGFFLINIDIAPGVWRNNGTGKSCYWSVTKADGDIIDNHFGQAGGTAYLPASGFQVQFNDCGTWTFIKP